jgi:ABC-type nitrate/sulfonate/bicarbonate transport system substrate-binding protein
VTRARNASSSSAGGERTHNKVSNKRSVRLTRPVAAGARFADAHPDKAQQYIGQYLKGPLSVVQATRTSPLQSAITVKQMQWWVDAMKAQRFLPNPIVLDRLIAN